MVVSRYPYAPDLRQASPLKHTVLRLHALELVEGSAYPSGLVNQRLNHLFLARDHPQSRQPYFYLSAVGGSYRERLRGPCHGGASTELNTGTTLQLSAQFPDPLA